jgi:LysM repeat protein
VVGVGHYRTVLKQYDDSLRQHASRMRLVTVRAGDDWPALADRLGIAVWELRLHNPFLAGRRPRAGELVAYPPEPRRDLLSAIDGGATYRMRHGDNYIKLAIALGLDPEAVRNENGLWQIQTVPAGVVLRFPLSIDRAQVIGVALADLAGTALAAESTLPAADEADGGTEPLLAALIPETPPAPAPEISAATIVHRVRRGETLLAIARRYGTSVAAIQRANGMHGTRIQVGQRLRIPRDRPSEA